MPGAQPPSPPPLDDLTYTPVPGSVRLARRRTIRLLTEQGWDEEAVYDAALIVSELASNVLRHLPGEPFRLMLGLCGDEGAVRIEVTDSGWECLPRIIRAQSGERYGGRGLQLVETVSMEWGVTVNKSTFTKAVWAVVAAKQLAG
ncbi:ATP-binding protein [Streptomyces sp. NBC_01262]|uniref:ATP-binding protein n=1 Tax=Streptomyces sp. NBC_01262 TaxID=2903803 RepID=UPI002E31607F|nr:ATP-binding protein [Streptomyces sp. NBC_01262]